MKGFWSLTLYNSKHLFSPNELNRYSLGTKNKNLKYNEDGSLTLYVSKKRPSEDKVNNWLPAPDGNLSLYIRAYWGNNQFWMVPGSRQKLKRLNKPPIALCL